MINALFALARPLINTLDAETAHHATIQALKIAPLPPATPDEPCLRVSAFGIDFPNPVGLAAGFDKNAEVPDAALKLGFGFAEVGGVTPLPQAGNARPRIFRLVADPRAVVSIAASTRSGIFLKYFVAVSRDRKSTRLNSSHVSQSRMPSSA